jgi:putative radical SAM enzyme (TIGR03279 family)
MQAVISHLVERGPAQEAGLKKGDIILSINGNPVNDIIDYMFYSQEDVLNFKVRRGARNFNFRLNRKSMSDPGIEIKSFRIRSCRNKCIFCFVNQLPKGMRKPLYVKDDDYRMSFLFGNYITLTNIRPNEKRRIFTQRLSPLYVSVHATDDSVRRKILGNVKAPPLLDQLQELASNKIRVHAQIVVCPGINDGEVLSDTIKDLQKLYPYVSSIAVVPVGITKYYRGRVRHVTRDEALRVIETVRSFRRRLKRRHGDPIVHLADEFYLRANVPLPPLKEYGDLPQIENGVGLLPQFLQSARKVKLPRKIPPRKVAIVTGVSFRPFLMEYASRLKTIEGLDMDVFGVENRFFGPSVTVAGLLTGKDIAKSIVGKTKADYLLIPSVMLKNGTDTFLDDVTLHDLQESTGMKVLSFEPTAEGLMRAVTNGDQRQYKDSRDIR